MRNPNETIKFYENCFNEYRMFTMAIAEEEEVLKFYFYAKYADGDISEMILMEVVIDRTEQSIGILFKFNRQDLFDFWFSGFQGYLRDVGIGGN